MNARQRIGTAALAALVSLTLAACGGGGGGGGGSNNDVAEALGYQTAEGSSTAPLAIGDLGATAVISYDGNVGNGSFTGGESFYLVQGATPGVDYTVTLANLTDDADVFVFPGDPTYSGDPTARTEQGFTDEAFTLAAEQDVTALFIQVDGSKTSKGAKYTLSVLPKPRSEGTADSPVDLFDQLPVSRPGSTVGHDETAGVGDGDEDTEFDSYYMVEIPATVAAGTRILISLSNPTADVDLYLTTDSTFATGFGDTAWNESSPANGSKRCKNLFNNAVSEACEYIATGSAVTLYIGVDGYYAGEGAAYTLNVTKAPIGSGTATTPCDLGDAPGIWDLNFTLGTGCGTYPLSVAVDTSEGIAKKGIVDANSKDSYYEIGGLEQGKTYVLTLEDLTDAAELYVSGKDSTFTTFLPECVPPYDNPKVQRCTFTAGKSSVSFAVDGYWTLAGSTYKISLFPEFVVMGTADSPAGLDDLADYLADPWAEWISGDDVSNSYVSLTVGPDAVLGVPSATPPAEPASAAPRFRTFAEAVPAGTNGDSYFAIPVDESCPGMEFCQYSVTLTGLSGDVNLYVYTEDTFTTPACTSFNGGTAAEKCVVSATSPTLYIAIDGYLATNGAAYTLTIRKLPLTGEGTPTAAQKIGSAPLKYEGKVIGNMGSAGGGDVVDSHYFFYGSPGKWYRATLYTKDPSGLDFYLRKNTGDSDNFSGGVAVGGVGCNPAPVFKDGKSCVFQFPSDTKIALIGVDGFNAEKEGGAYSFGLIIEETEEPPAATVAELVLDGNFTYEGTGIVKYDKSPGIGFPGKSLDSFYTFTVTKAGTYRVLITGVGGKFPQMTGDADLYVFPPMSTTGVPTWDNPIPKKPLLKGDPACPNTQRGQDTATGAYLDEYCDITVTQVPSVFYFAVDGYNLPGKELTHAILIGPAN